MSGAVQLTRIYNYQEIEVVVPPILVRSGICKSKLMDHGLGQNVHGVQLHKLIRCGLLQHFAILLSNCGQLVRYCTEQI